MSVLFGADVQSSCKRFRGSANADHSHNIKVPQKLFANKTIFDFRLKPCLAVPSPVRCVCEGLGGINAGASFGPSSLSEIPLNTGSLYLCEDTWSWYPQTRVIISNAGLFCVPPPPPSYTGTCMVYPSSVPVL